VLDAGAIITRTGGAEGARSGQIGPEGLSMRSFGEELKRERELREISLREIAEATKVNIRYLEAMERNEFEHLPGGVFNRGFVRAYAQFIGVDPDAMVNAYLMEEQARASTSAPSEGPLLRGRATAEHTRSNGPVPRPAAAERRHRGLLRWSLLGLLLVALIVAAIVVTVLFTDTWAAAGTLARGDTGRQSEAGH
jgi:cytoskeletal protein RodZ